MLIIRLTRRGRRNDPSFRLVVTERSNPVKGKFLEELGFYNPKLKERSFKKDRILYWLGKGAKASPTVHNLLVNETIISGPKVRAWRPKVKGEEEQKKSQEATKNKEAVKEELKNAVVSLPDEPKKIETEVPEQKEVSEIKLAAEEEKKPDID